MAYRLFIFDFDGTLADSGPWAMKAINLAAAKFGYAQLSDEEIEALRGLDNRAILKKLKVSMWRLPRIAAYFKKLAREAESPPLFAGVAEMLRALQTQGATLAVVSSNSEEAIRRALGPESAALFTHYACDASLFGKAPKFRSVLKASRTHRRDAVAIGDETRDIEAARKAGIACGAVAWGYATPDLLRAHKPDHLFASPADIAALLK